MFSDILVAEQLPMYTELHERFERRIKQVFDQLSFEDPLSYARGAQATESNPGVVTSAAIESWWIEGDSVCMETPNPDHWVTQTAHHVFPAGYLFDYMRFPANARLTEDFLHEMVEVSSEHIGPAYRAAVDQLYAIHFGTKGTAENLAKLFESFDQKYNDVLRARALYTLARTHGQSLHVAGWAQLPEEPEAYVHSWTSELYHAGQAMKNYYLADGSLDEMDRMLDMVKINSTALVGRSFSMPALTH